MIPAPLATHTIAFLLGANLALLVVIFVLLALVLRGIADLTAMHHDVIVRLLVQTGARPVGPVVQEQYEGAGERRVA